MYSLIHLNKCLWLQVRFFYSFTCRDNLYLVMEYLNGGDLYSLLRNVGCLEEDIARIYVAELVVNSTICLFLFCFVFFFLNYAHVFQFVLMSCRFSLWSTFILLELCIVIWNLTTYWLLMMGTLRSGVHTWWSSHFLVWRIGMNNRSRTLQPIEAAFDQCLFFIDILVIKI